MLHSLLFDFLLNVKCRADLGNTLAGVYGNNFDVHNTAQKTQSFTLENSDSIFIYIFLFVCLLVCLCFFA